MTTEQLAQGIGYQTKRGITKIIEKISVSKIEGFQLGSN